MSKCKSILFKLIFLLTQVLVHCALGQSNPASMASIQAEAQNDLRAALKALEQTESKIADEKLAVSIELQALEQQVINLRQQLKERRRNQDAGQTEFQKLREINDALEA